MDQQQKQEVCERICGEAAKRGVHSMAPEMCPILLDEWRNPPRDKRPKVAA
jgi:hypothetical protein